LAGKPNGHRPFFCNPLRAGGSIEIRMIEEYMNNVIEVTELSFEAEVLQAVEKAASATPSRGAAASR
jgi:hypothetical protein